MHHTAAGFRFGLILQAAIGPITIYIFSLAINSSVSAALLAVAVALAAAGITAWIRSERYAPLFKTIGAAVMALFGLLLLFEAWGIALLPNMTLLSAPADSGPFLTGIIITAANPLTLLFWGGVCSARMAENGLSRRQMYLFGAGAALSTLICQSAAALAGSALQMLVMPQAVLWMNSAAGILLIAAALNIPARIAGKKRRSRA